MLRKKAIIVVTVVLFLLTSSMLVVYGAAVDQRGVLSGRVTYLLTPGTAVREGDILARVDTITGPVPAARATTNGVVTEVLVRSGDVIRIGDIIARIEAGK